MQKIILIKTHPSIQLAHLYEHLYCTRLKELFYDHKLYKYLDFSMHGTTFNHGGLIEIEIELYTPKAIAVSGELQQQKIFLNQTNISTAFTQILAEEEAPINTTGLENIQKALSELDQSSWQHIDDFDVFDAKSTPLKKMPVYIDPSHHLQTRKITTTLSLEQEFATSHRDLIPLFRHIAKLITFTTQDQLAIKHGYYCDEVTFKATARQTHIQAVLKVANLNNETVDLERDISDCIDIIKEIQSVEAFEKLMSELRATSYSERFWLAPNTYDSFDETGVYIGPKGWQRIATTSNLTLILKNITLEMKFGRNKVTHELDIF